MRETVPTAAKVGFLGSRKVWDSPLVSTLREAAQQLGMSVLGPPMESPIHDEEYRRVVGAMAQEHVDGVIIGDQAEHFPNRQLIVDLVGAAKLPAIFPYREYFEIGALMVYGSSVLDAYRRLAVYVDQILKGARPGDLPIYLASKFDLLINSTTQEPSNLPSRARTEFLSVRPLADIPFVPHAHPFYGLVPCPALPREGKQ